MNEYLKPCPFCGGKKNVVESYSAGYYTVQCKTLGCLMSVKGATREEAISSWNKRAGDAPALKRCPFCGSPAEISRNDSDYEPMYTVNCSNSECQAQTVSSSDVQDVTAIWDKRAKAS